MLEPEKKLTPKKLWRTAAGVEGEQIRRSSPEYRAKNRAYYHRKQAETAEHRAAVKAAKAEQLRIERAQLASARAERRREQHRAWKVANPGRMQALVRSWRARNPEKRAADRKARRIARRKRLVDFLMKKQGGCCAYCEIRLAGRPVHVDHKTPRAAGGSNKRENLHLTCEPCNLAKGIIPHEVFALCWLCEAA